MSDMCILFIIGINIDYAIRHPHDIVAPHESLSLLYGTGFLEIHIRLWRKATYRS